METLHIYTYREGGGAKWGLIGFPKGATVSMLVGRVLEFVNVGPSVKI